MCKFSTNAFSSNRFAQCRSMSRVWAYASVRLSAQSCQILCLSRVSVENGNKENHDDVLLHGNRRLIQHEREGEIERVDCLFPQTGTERRHRKFLRKAFNLPWHRVFALPMPSEFLMAHLLSFQCKPGWCVETLCARCSVMQSVNFNIGSGRSSKVIFNKRIGTGTHYTHYAIIRKPPIFSPLTYRAYRLVHFVSDRFYHFSSRTKWKLENHSWSVRNCWIHSVDQIPFRFRLTLFGTQNIWGLRKQRECRKIIQCSVCCICILRIYEVRASRAYLPEALQPNCLPRTHAYVGILHRHRRVRRNS